MNRSLIALLLLAASLPLQAGEVVKWVDERGKVHYGEKAPDEYKDSAEKVETEINIVAPEDDIKLQNRKHASQLKREDEWRKSQEVQTRVQNQQQEPEPSKNKIYTREECRDMYPNRTADRVACFKRAEEAGLK